MTKLLLHNLINVLFAALYKEKAQFDIKTYVLMSSNALHVFPNLKDILIPKVAQTGIIYPSTISVYSTNNLFDCNMTSTFTLLKSCSYVITRKWVRFISNASLPDELLVYTLRGS